MYEENEKQFNWGSIIKKIVVAIVAILILLGLIAMITKCTKKEDSDIPTNKVIDLTEQLDKLETATLAYLTKDNVPVELNASKTIRLKILINKNLLTSLTDSEGNKCDVNESYSEITRLDNNYAVKMSLTCGSNKDYRIIYVGCFSECNGGICKGTESSTGGICNVTQKPDNSNSNDNSNTTTKPNNTNTKPNTNSNSNSTTKKPTNTTNSNTNNNNKPNSNTSTNTTKKETLYEYKKCTDTSLSCTPNSDGYCSKLITSTLEGVVIKVSGGETKKETTTSKVAATSVPNVSTSTQTIYLPSTNVKNTATVTYKFIKYVPSRGYQFEKTTKTTTYTKKCNVGTPDGKGYCIVTNTKTYTTPVVYGCADKTFKYDKNTNKCTKTEEQIQYFKPTSYGSTCQYTWSYSSNLEGWTKTGRTK